MNKRRSPAKVDVRRWATYSTAAAASLLSGMQAVDLQADIHCEHPDVLLRDTNSFDASFETLFFADLGRGGYQFGIRFEHRYLGPGYISGLSYHGWAQIYGRNHVNTDSYSIMFAAPAFGRYNYLSNLEYGEVISDLNFVTGDRRNGYLARQSGFPGSQFVNRDGYIAFKFDVGEGTQYGWAEFGLVSGTPRNIFTLHSVCYADPNEPLFVGQTGVIPEPNALGCLALGSLGLLAWRRKRRNDTTIEC